MLFFFNDTATTEIYTLSLHDALPIYRSDLNYLIGEMISELSTSHTYVGGGDQPQWTHVNVGMLGADFEPDGAYYRDRKSTRLNSSHSQISYAVFCLKKNTTVLHIIGV